MASMFGQTWYENLGDPGLGCGPSWFSNNFKARILMNFLGELLLGRLPNLRGQTVLGLISAFFFDISLL